MTIETKRNLSRRSALMVIGSSIPLLGLSATMADASKMSQKTAHYVGTPKNGKNCAGCKFFEAPHSCKIVDGNIDANGWCMLWRAK